MKRHPTPVVVDINVLVEAVTGGEEASFEYFPSPPPVRGNLAAHVVGICNDAQEFSLHLSPHLLDGTLRVLTDRDEGFGWPKGRASQYISILRAIARRSGGTVITPGIEVVDCRDWEDNRVLELAETVGALLIVSSDEDLLSMSPWRGTPVMSPGDFVRRVDVMRRARLREGPRIFE